MAKALMLMADERLVVAVTPVDRMLDLDKAREALGGEQIRLAEERVRPALSRLRTMGRTAVRRPV